MELSDLKELIEELAELKAAATKNDGDLQRAIQTIDRQREELAKQNPQMVARLTEGRDEAHRLFEIILPQVEQTSELAQSISMWFERFSARGNAPGSSIR